MSVLMCAQAIKDLNFYSPIIVALLDIHTSPALLVR